MNKKEALIAVIQMNVPDNSLEKALLDNDLVSDDDYTKEDKEDIDFCAVDLLRGLWSAPNISEGGYSISFDRAAIKERLSALCNDLGLEDPTKAMVRGADNVW
jgi:hypothetical protein